jgi:hypothetical protein
MNPPPMAHQDLENQDWGNTYECEQSLAVRAFLQPAVN